MNAFALFVLGAAVAVAMVQKMGEWRVESG